MNSQPTTRTGVVAGPLYTGSSQPAQQGTARTMGEVWCRVSVTPPGARGSRTDIPFLNPKPWGPCPGGSEPAKAPETPGPVQGAIDVASATGKVAGHLVQPAFWKGVGLLTLAIGIGFFGLMLWLGKEHPQAVRAGMEAAAA